MIKIALKTGLAVLFDMIGFFLLEIFFLKACKGNITFEEFVYIAFVVVFVFIMCAIAFAVYAVVSEIKKSNKEIQIKIDNLVEKTTEVSNSISEKTTETSDSMSKKSETWVCSKCGAENPIGARLCQSCGR